MSIFIRMAVKNEKQLLVIILFFTSLQLKSQVLMSYIKSEKPNYCLKDSANSKTIIGRQIKIWHEGGVYSTLNTSKNFKWKSNEWKSKGGKNVWGSYEPKAGDIGNVVHIFYDKRSSNTKYIYLLKIKDNYVPLACSYITDADRPDNYEEFKQHYITDSINNIKYAAGCKFKIRNINDTWSRAGLMNIDKISETFACNLISKGIDTVMLCKYIFDNGSLPIEKAFVLWLDKGHGFVKAFFNNPKHQPTENKPTVFNATSLFNYFFENKLDTITSKPTSASWISHSLGYNIQLYTPNIFFRERLTDFLIRQDKSHPKSIWWNMISEQLEKIKED